MDKELVRLSEGELSADFERSIQEAIDLNKHDVRTVRGKYRGYSRVFADYQEESDGALTFLGYRVNHSVTDFTSEVNKTADRAIDFGHFYHVRREFYDMNDNGYESDIRVSYLSENPDYNPDEPSSRLKNPRYLIDLTKVGAMGHQDKNLVNYGEFSQYVGGLYRQEQAILKEIVNIPADKWKGSNSNTAYSSSEDEADTATTIRGSAKQFTGADADWAEIDIITEIELLIIDMFDSIDNISCDDSTKMDIVRYAASIVGKKRFGTTSAVAHRATPRGSGKIALKPTKTNVAEALLRDMKHYTIDNLENVGPEDASYFDDLSALRKSINQKDSEDDYTIEDEGKVIPRISTAKKRGDGYTAFKNMSSKYRDAHKDAIDDEDW